MRIKLLAVLVLASACGDDSPATQRLDGGFLMSDAPEFAPEITSFRATPNTNIPAGTPTAITWTWDYLVEPTFPTPTCTIDNGVGAVTNGQMTMVTLTQVTTFTLTCTNSQGTTNRQTIVSVPPVAPSIATFTVSPTTLATPNTAQNYTFTWTYANTPSPAPTCYVDGASTSPMTSGTQVSVTLTQARTFHLRCTNAAAGTAATFDATVQVTECGTAYAQCNPNASCTDTVNGYTCSCAGGFTTGWLYPNSGSSISTSTTNSTLGDTCYLNSGSAANCDSNATWNGTYCACNAGFVGSGATGDCVRARIAFVTSVTGSGAILNGTGGWATGTGATGLQWADDICMDRAAAGSLPAATYKAWLSDQTDDAYCRIAGFAGKKGAKCGQGTLPTSGGPWVRWGDRRPFAPTLDKLVAPTRQLFYPAIYTELAGQVAQTQKVWTATTDLGEFTTNGCTDWSSNSAGVRGTTGLAHGGPSSWTRDDNNVNTLDPTCNLSAALLCMEVDVGNGPALPPRHPPPTSKKAFLTSVSGTGNLAGWPDAHGVTGSYGYQAPDEICKSRARYAGYAGSASYKAWFSTYIYSATSRMSFVSYPYYRPDGVVLGISTSDILDYSTTRELNASWSMTELNTYEPGDVDSGFVWTGMTYTGSYQSSIYHCGSSSTTYWTNGTNSYNTVLGKFGLLDDRYSGGGYNTSYVYVGCDSTARLYCVED